MCPRSHLLVLWSLCGGVAQAQESPPPDSGAAQQPAAPTQAAPPVQAGTVAAETAPSPGVEPAAAAPATVMVLPVSLNLPAAQAEGLGPVLTDALTHAMAERKHHPTVSADELRQMVERDAASQGAGCDATCTAEIAGALGARLAVTSEVSRQGQALVWSASLVELADARVLMRGSVRGKGTQALVNLAAELAAALHGEPGATLLKGDPAMRRLGLEDREALRAFASFRDANPQWTTTEAFTTFLARRNLELPATSVAEAALVGGAVALAISTVAAVGAGVAVGILLNPAVGVVLLLGGITMALGAAGLGMAGVVLLAVDALNLGRVKVQRAGCCRDDAALQDLEDNDGWHRAAAVTFLLHPPVMVGALFVTVAALLALLSVSGLVASALPDLGGGTLANVLHAALALVAVPLTVLVVLPALLASPVVGLLLLFWPNRRAVQDQPASARPPPAREKP